MSGNDSDDSETKSKPNRLGCSHYARKCSFISPCCKNEYPCRVCHDESETHEIDRTKVQQVKCLVCSLVQGVHKICEKCETVFGKYFCAVCRLYDDEDKGQFHCEGCGLCRIGGKEKFFHCDKCDMCLGVQLKGKHKCVEESSRRNCAVCLDDLHTSRISAHIPACGHLIHKTCLDHCLRTGNYACPVCAQSLVEMKSVWKQLDNEVANTPMPDEYKNFRVYVLCRDCHQESEVVFHVIGLKCPKCGSYNTCRTAGPDGLGSMDDGPPISAEAGPSVNSSTEDGQTQSNSNGPPSENRAAGDGEGGATGDGEPELGTTAIDGEPELGTPARDGEPGLGTTARDGQSDVNANEVAGVTEGSTVVGSVTADSRPISSDVTESHTGGGDS